VLLGSRGRRESFIDSLSLSLSLSLSFVLERRFSSIWKFNIKRKNEQQRGPMVLGLQVKTHVV
jgi:hypothetical protein